MSHLPEHDASVVPVPEASSEQVADLLQAIEAFDPWGNQFQIVRVPEVVAERCTPYIDARAPAFLRVRNPAMVAERPEARSHNLGAAVLTSSVRSQAVRGLMRGWYPSMLTVSYTAHYPAPGVAGNERHGLFVVRSAIIDIEDNYGGTLKVPIEEQRYYDETTPERTLPASLRRLLLSGTIGRIVGRQRPAERPAAFDDMALHRREQWVGETELAAVIDCVQQAT